MTINILRGKTTKKKGVTPPDAIGEPDAHVFNCPKCARPLSDGTPKCPSCGQRLILGVALRRATILAGFGLAIGVFIGAVLTSGAITTLLSSAASAVASTVDSVTPTAAPSATAAATDGPAVTPAPVEPTTIPPAAISALIQTSLLDARIVSDASDLAAARSQKSTVEIARAMRALASDAANGAAQTSRLKTWTGASTVVTLRSEFYQRIADKALASLRMALAEGKAYRAAAADMLHILSDLPGLDAMSRGLAVAAEVDLPTVDYGVLAR